ncbi:MAG: DUF433 domain-containing protein [Magnetospirillum sp.]|nr:DUF433 domain-containing protein [Magnetospirillum sp.]
MNVEMLTPAEAAVVASVSVRDVNRAIDEKILPEEFYTVADGRRVRLAACPLVGFYFRAAGALTAEERLRLIGRFSERMANRLAERPLSGWRSADWTVKDGFLTVDLKDFVADADDRAARLTAAQDMVVEDPAILGGTPVIRDTRIPVYDVVASVTAGLSRERILAAYPRLDDTMVDLAVLYAEANPVRGRPRRFAALPAGATVTSERTVRRRTK